MIKEDYVSFETSKLLKKKGFDEECRAYYVKSKECGIELFLSDRSRNYNDDVYPRTSAPTLQMALKWLREEKDVQIEITIVGTDIWESPTKWMYGFRCQTKNVIDRRNADFSSYEQACEAAIRHCLENFDI